MSQTIFERYGGFAAVRKVVSTFYDYILEDDVMAPYSEGVDMRRQIDRRDAAHPKARRCRIGIHSGPSSARWSVSRSTPTTSSDRA